MNDDIKLILIGWLLGIFSTLLIHFLQRLFKKVSIKSGIRLELNDARARIATVAYKMRMRFGKLDKEFIELTSKVMAKMKHDPNFTKFAEVCNKQIHFTEAEIAKLNMLDKAKAGVSLSMKTFKLPYLESKIADLSLYSEKFQYHCLSTLNDLRLINQAIEESIFYFRVSYTAGLADETYNKASIMTEQTFEKIGERAEMICTKINILLKET